MGQKGIALIFLHLKEVRLIDSEVVVVAVVEEGKAFVVVVVTGKVVGKEVVAAVVETIVALKVAVVAAFEKVAVVITVALIVGVGVVAIALVVLMVKLGFALRQHYLINHELGYLWWVDHAVIIADLIMDLLMWHLGIIEVR